MAYLEVDPLYKALFRSRGLLTTRTLLSLPGVIVGGHADRHVVEVILPGNPAGGRFFLKKEHQVRWRDRLVSVWDGLGWASRSVREARLLQQARAAGIGCPYVAAFGEDRPRAFLLLRAEEGLVDLRVLLAQMSSAGARRALAEALGEAVARLHQGGFHHPDLYAKHVLAAAAGSSFHFCFLDWQRACRVKRVPWRWRLRDLAALDAGLAATLAGPRLRLQCLRAYLRVVGKPALSLAQAGRAIHQHSVRLLTRRKVRALRQVPLPATAQQLVWLDGERLCVVGDFHEELGGKVPAWLPPAPTPPPEGHVEHLRVRLLDGRDASLTRRWQPLGAGRTVAEPALAAALFDLQRFGVRAPRLLAMGQQQVDANQRYSFVLLEPPSATSWPEALTRVAPGPPRWQRLRALGRILRQIHEAGYALPAGPAPLQGLGLMPDGEPVVLGVERLQKRSAGWRQLALADLTHEAGAALAHWPRTDRLRLVLGYLGISRLDDEGRRLAEMLVLQDIEPREGRVAR